MGSGWTNKLLEEYKLPKDKIKFDLGNYQDCLGLFALTSISIWMKSNCDE